jgi:hypothetical protein
MHSVTGYCDSLSAQCVVVEYVQCRFCVVYIRVSTLAGTAACSVGCGCTVAGLQVVTVTVGDLLHQM